MLRCSRRRGERRELTTIGRAQMASPPAVSDAEDLSRLEVRVAGELAGWLDYRPGGDSMIIAHTEVLDGHQGEGLGGVLVRRALEKARGAGKTVIATCPFALSLRRQASRTRRVPCAVCATPPLA